MARADASPCPECGVENAADHNFCKHCGFALKAVAVDAALTGNFAERSRDRCLELIKAYPENPSAHFNLGLAFYHLGQVGKAQRAFQRVVGANANDPSAHYHLGLLYERKGLDGCAMSALARALELDPSDTAAATALQELQR